MTSSNNCIFSSLKPPNVPLLLNSAKIFLDNSSAIASWYILISSNMVKIVTWGGGNYSESGCLVCFIPSNVCFWKLYQRRRKLHKNSWRKKGPLNIIFGEVVFISFLSCMNFLTDYVWIISFKFGSQVIKEIRFPRSDILIGIMPGLIWVIPAPDETIYLVAINITR